MAFSVVDCFSYSHSMHNLHVLLLHFFIGMPFGNSASKFFVTAGGGSVLCERGVSFIICIGVFILLLTRLFADSFYRLALVCWEKYFLVVCLVGLCPNVC